MSSFDHTFKPGETVNAVFRFYNGDILTPEELTKIRAEFNRLNGEVNPRPGCSYKIPILEDDDE